MKVDMKVGIAGAGNVGATLAVCFRKIGCAVKIANSRSPETLTKVADETGATPVLVKEVARGVDFLVVSIPMKSVLSLPSDLLCDLGAEAVIVDTGNYIPMRDGLIQEIEEGMTESEWTSSVLGRPVIKAFNNITTFSLSHGGFPKGSQSRIALPVSGDDVKAKQLLSEVLDKMGFDSVDTGPLSESWRQHPGTPAYATDYDAALLSDALASADRASAPRMRDAGMQRLLSLPPDTTPQEITRLARSFWTEHRQGERILILY